VAKVVRKLEPWQCLEPDRWASAEAQVAALSDDIAYLNHDLDDGLRAGLVTLGDLKDVPLAGEAAAGALASRSAPDGSDGRTIYEITRRMITMMIRDLVAETRARLAELAPASPDEIRSAGRATVAFSSAFEADMARLKGFLFERVYRAPRVKRVMADAEAVVGDLFRRYHDDERVMPEAWAALARSRGERQRVRVIGDFVAGMTDRYALQEHRRLFDATPELR
jgi:dGTPase